MVLNNKNLLCEAERVIFYGRIQEIEKKTTILKSTIFSDKRCFVCDAESTGRELSDFESIRIEDVDSLKDVLVIFVTDLLSDISAWTIVMSGLGTRFSSYHFFDYSNKICAGYIQRMQYSESIDMNGNIVRLSNKPNANYDRVFITYQYPESTKNNILELGDISVANGNHLECNFLGSNGSIVCGDGTTFVRTFLQVGKDGKITVGNDSMFSIDTRCFQSDSHHIFDLKTGKRINYGKHISIGNHVWIGRTVTVLGGFTIGDNSIVGSHSVSSGEFGENQIIAGSPATVIRKDVMWARDSSEVYNHEEYSQCKDKAGLKYLKLPLGLELNNGEVYD